MSKSITTSMVRSTTAEASEFRKLIRRLARKWRVPSLVDTTVEWSHRLTRSLGLAFPERMLIRLDVRLRDPRYASTLQEVLCHELAHLAVYALYGRDAAMHGLEWRRLVEAAGYEPRIGIHIPELVSIDSSSVRYEHFCPRCHAKRFAKRRQTTWRCVACRRRGLEGLLIIRPQVNDKRGAR